MKKMIIVLSLLASCESLNAAYEPKEFKLCKTANGDRFFRVKNTLTNKGEKQYQYCEKLNDSDGNSITLYGDTSYVGLGDNCDDSAVDLCIK